jgi:hypothetical protein
MVKARVQSDPAYPGSRGHNVEDKAEDRASSTRNSWFRVGCNLYGFRLAT